jgi:hypothetical protein
MSIVHRKQKAPPKPGELQAGQDCIVQHAAILEQMKGIVALSQQSQVSLNTKMEAHLADEPLWQRGVDVKLDEVVNKLTAVMEIRVNGATPLPGEFPLVTSLRGIHDTIRDVQLRREFWGKFREYRRQSWFFQMLASKTLRTILAVAAFLAVNTVAKTFGIHLTFDALLKVFGIGG